MESGRSLGANAYSVGLGVGLSASGDLAILQGQAGDFTPEAYVFAVPTLSVSTPASATRGTLFNITVTAQDSAGATVTGYTDSVQFASSDASATLPADSTLTNGTGQFPVTLFTAGDQTITATDTTYSSITGASAPVNVLAPLPPLISKAFGIPSIPLNLSATTLVFSIANPNTTSSLSGVGFTDALPPGLVIASPSGLAGACGVGTITAVAGSGSASLSGATLAAGSLCSFSVRVTPASAGIKNNVTSAVTSNEAGTGNTASASLTVVAPPSLAVSFGAAAIPLNGVTSLTYTITNSAANTVPLTGVAFTDIFPPDMFVASPNGLANTCGGTPSAVAGSGSVSLSGATLAAGSSCTLAANITVTAAATYTSNPTVAVSANGGTGNPASALLTVLVPITLDTVPAGLAIFVDGTSYTGGQTLQLPGDSTHTISVVTPQPGTYGTRYVFHNWSDGGALSHVISVFTPATYTATFTTQYRLTLAVTPKGSGTVTPASGGFYDAGTSAALTATASTGYIFNTWTGAANPPGSATAAVVMSGPESVTATFLPAAQPPPPILLNGASFQPALAAPNTILSMFGDGLSCASTPQMLVNGVQAEVLFSSAAQINFVIPAGLGGTGNAGVQVVCNSVNSPASVVASSPADPAIFTLTEKGAGQAAVLNQNYTVNGSQSPAGLGSYISVYVTGFGDLGPAGPDGLRRLTLPVTASIGGVGAQVSYAGEAPGYTSGLQQINVLIPGNAPAGSAVPIQLAVNGANTQSGVTIAIR